MTKLLWQGKINKLLGDVSKIKVGPNEELAVIVVQKDDDDQQKANQPTLCENAGGGTAPSQEEQKQEEQKQEPTKQELKKVTSVKRLRSILKDNMKRRPLRNKSSGDICHKELYKITTSGKIFEKRRLSDKKYYVSLIIDRSGSMEDNTTKAGKIFIDIAIMSFLCIVEDLRDVIDFELISFNDRAHHHLKFSDKKTNARLLKEAELIKTNCRGDTRLGTALDITNKSLKKLGNGQKIVLVITDGWTGDPEYCAKIIKKLKSNGIPTLGVMLESPYWDARSKLDAKRTIATYLKNCLFIDNVDELYPVLVKLLKKAIGRRNH